MSRSKPNTGRRLQIFVGAIAVALLVAFVLVRTMRGHAERELANDTKLQATTPPSVVVVAAAPAPSSVSLTLPGETAAWFESTIYARVNGYVATWLVDIGDHVVKGQVLATIDTPDLDAELAASQAQLKAAAAGVKVREAESQFARTTYERWRDSPKGVVSEQERDAKKADFASAAARVNAAIAEVNADQGKVDRLNALTQFKQVTAPYDGTIVERRIDIGNLVTAGSTNATTLLYRMTRNDPMRIFVDVPQNAAPDMTIGLAASIVANGEPGQPLRGTITRTAKALDPQARTLRVEIDLANADDRLVPGMYVQTTFALKAEGTVEVPAAAMIFRPSGPRIAVVRPDGTVDFRDVEIARDNGNVVEIGSGLKPGDKIVLNISNQIAAGEKVVAIEAQQGLAGAVAAAPK